ncbi:hypothetical protein JHK87_023293 [Glycine soja]|nr:hypothetical protein JHK87_023293 [Glycine soja]
MKCLALFALFLLLSAFTSYLPSATAEFVYDKDGNKLENKGFYYILDANLGGGGIEGAATGNETCPLTVVQSLNELHSGLPILISSLTFVRFISEERMLRLEFVGWFEIRLLNLLVMKIQ